MVFNKAEKFKYFMGLSMVIVASFMALSKYSTTFVVTLSIDPELAKIRRQSRFQPTVLLVL